MEEEQIVHLAPFKLYGDFYYERFVIKGIIDMNPALQEFLFDDDCVEDVAIIAEGNWIWVVASSYIYELQAQVIASNLLHRLKTVGIEFEHWEPSHDTR